MKYLLLTLFCVLFEKNALAQTAVKDSFPENFTEAAILQPGSTYVLRSLEFQPDHHIFKPGTNRILDTLYDVLQRNSATKIIIEGHVCCIKNAPDALDVDNDQPKLSANRARAVYDYLVQKGIDSSRLTYLGFGHAHPVIQDEKTATDAAQNRRVEIRIIEK